MTPHSFDLTVGRRSWGRVERGPQYVASPAFLEEAALLLQRATDAGLSVLAGGLGRSYGDSALNLGHAVIDTTRLDRVIAFDCDRGVLRAEAGLSLSETVRRVLPHGWFLPTTPGTRFVTLGGAVANDVHGKNHHQAGAFGCSVRRLGLIRSDRGLIELSPAEEPELFAATIGGLGLTGLIAWVEIQLAPVRSAYLDQETVAFPDLDGFFALSRESETAFEHTVAWVDCTRAGQRLGRGVFNRALWRNDGRLDTHDDERMLTLPVDLPNFALNPITLKLFNEQLYLRAPKGRPARSAQHYVPVFYPLDVVGRWNRLYGSRGFFQYQCQIPPDCSRDAVRELLQTIAKSGEGSFLAVLKTFGEKRSPGLLSFPSPGVTLALDFANKGDETYALLSRLDDITAAAGGRLYPAKDGRIPPAMFRAGYSNWERFSWSVDPAFSSSFWRRVNNG